MINNYIPSKLRLPYSMVAGSVAQRKEKVCYYTERMSQEILKIIEDDSINIDKIQEIISKIMPQGLSIRVLETKGNDDAYAYCSTFFNQNNQISGMAMEFLSEDKKLPIEGITDIIHEWTHVLDSLFHPKYLIREQKMEQRGLNTKKYAEVFNEQLDIYESASSKKEIREILKIIERKIHKFLKGYNTEDKINILQDMRYNLETEKNAYKAQNKYGNIYKELGVEICEDRYNDGSNCLYDEKIKLIKQMAFDVISNARKKNNKRLRFAKSVRNN